MCRSDDYSVRRLDYSTIRQQSQKSGSFCVCMQSCVLEVEFDHTMKCLTNAAEISSRTVCSAVNWQQRIGQLYAMDVLLVERKHSIILQL